MTDDEHEYRRKNDIFVTRIQDTLDNFVKRYESDLGRQNASLAEILRTIQSHDDFIRDIKPAYAKGMIALGVFCVGSIGVATTWLWKHVRWG